MWKPGTAEPNLLNAPAFRLILEPGDWAQDADRGPTVAREDAVRLPPVLLLDDDDLLDRDLAQQELGLDDRRLNVLVSLGAGRLNDTQDVTRACLEALSADPRVQVCLARSAISAVGHDAQDAIPVDRYPLGRYMRAFDAAVVASGYNSFHEVIQGRVPSLQVPNLDTRVDDQPARARAAAAGGVALAWTPQDDGPVEAAVRALLDDAVRASMVERLRATRLDNGAAMAARHVADLVDAA
jgi:UDP:flavonoid glycosyltransferase YjiC (YdhE family)